MSSPSSPRYMFIALGMVVLSAASGQSLLVPALPLIQADLGTDTVGITWTLTIYLITAAICPPLLGRIGDVVGKRRAFLFATIAVAVGNLVTAIAQDLTTLLFGQMLKGVGGSAVNPLAFALVRDSVPSDRVPGGIGVISFFLAAGGIVGGALAGPLSEIAGWQGLFALPFLGSSIGGILVLRNVRESVERASGRINILAALLLSAGLVALLVPLSSASVWGWASLRVIGLFSLATILLAGWVTVELRSREPLVDMRMMRLPGVWNANVAALLIGVTMYGGWAFLARFLQEPAITGYGLGASVSEAGFAMLPMLVLISLAGFLVGPLSPIARPPAQVVGSAVLIALSAASIALFHTHIWMLSTAAALLGIGLGLFYAAIATVIVQSVPATQTGVAGGINWNFSMIGSAVGTALMTAIVTGSASAEAGPTEAGYVTGFLILASLAVLAAIVAALVRPFALSAAHKEKASAL